MKKRLIGPDKLEVSALGLGCMGMTHGYGVIQDTNEMIKFMHAALDLGVTMFDTAEYYANNNEELVGKGLAGHREKAVIATKCGIYTINGKKVIDNTPERLRLSLEESLKKLQTDYIDLYYLHRFNGDTPVEVVAETMKQFIKEGKIRCWGMSEVSTETIRRANAVCPLTAVESEYSMMWREPEAELIPVLEELNIGFVPFAPLCKGFLTGTMGADTKFAANDNRSNRPRFSPENMAANQVMVEFIKEVAAGKNALPTQIALAWLLAQKPFITPIPGTTKVSRLEQNIAATEIVFTDDELKEINHRLSEIKISGHRYNAELQSRVGK